MSTFIVKESDYHQRVDYHGMEHAEYHVEQKLDNILNILKGIDELVISQERRRAHPPAPSIPLPKSPVFLIDPHMPRRVPPLPPRDEPVSPKSQASCTNISPPRPPKNVNAIKPMQNRDGTLTFTGSQCHCLTLQLLAVHKFIDDSFEDNYVDKEINMNCLNSVIRSLRGQKK